jgi:hypothetical protein
MPRAGTFRYLFRNRNRLRLVSVGSLVEARTVFTLINADADDDDAEITDPQEIAELFAAIAAVAIETLGPGQVRELFDAVVEQEGRDPN